MFWYPPERCGGPAGLGRLDVAVGGQLDPPRRQVAAEDPLHLRFPGGVHRENHRVPVAARCGNAERLARDPHLDRAPLAVSHEHKDAAKSVIPLARNTLGPPRDPPRRRRHPRQPPSAAAKVRAGGRARQPPGQGPYPRSVDLVILDSLRFAAATSGRPSSPGVWGATATKGRASLTIEVQKPRRQPQAS